MVPENPCSSPDLVTELFGFNRPHNWSAKWANFHTNFHLIQGMSPWNQLAFILNDLLSSFVTCATLSLFIPCSSMLFWGHCSHLRRCFERWNEAPLAWSQVNNSSWLMFLFLLLVPALWLSLLYPTFCFFLPPLHTQYRSRCVCARSHSWPPPSVYASLNTSCPKQPLLSPPIWHTLSPASCVETGTVLWHVGVHSIYISHFQLSCEYIYRCSLNFSPWKQVILLSCAWCHTWICLIFWNLKNVWKS